MVISCSAYACSNKWSRDSPIHFHKFPFRSRDLCEKWIKALKRKDFIPTKASLVCSDHFREEDYVDKPNLTKRMLKKDAVPSIFNFPVSYLSNGSPNNLAIMKKRKSFGVRRKELIDMDHFDSLIHELEVMDENGKKRTVEDVNVEVFIEDVDNVDDIIYPVTDHDSMEICNEISNMYNIDEEDDLLEMAEADEEDQCYIMGSIWGERLKLLSEDIRSRVREIINQIFKDAQKGTLNENLKLFDS